jgi:hypothetical protein
VSRFALEPRIFAISCLCVVLVHGGWSSKKPLGTAARPVAAVERKGLYFVPFGRGLPLSGQWREGFAIADMNGDGHPDIVHGPARKQPGPPVIFLGDGKGSWRQWREAKFPPLPYDYGDAQVADFNGDGKPDIALAVHLRGLIVLLGDGSGGFTDASQGLDFIDPSTGARGFSSRAIRVTDWNGDGRPDIIAVWEGPAMAAKQRGGIGPVVGQGVVIYLNQGTKGWTRRAHPAAGPAIFSDSLTLGDFNGDGRTDFATGSNVMGRNDLVNLWQPGGDWTPVALNVLRPLSYVWAVNAADFDGDGKADLAVSYTSFDGNRWQSGIDVLFSRGAGKWERRELATEQSREGPVALASGDLEGDGKKSLVALTTHGDTWVFIGDGKGGFIRNQTIPPFPGRCRGAHVELADVDGDGKDEIVESFADEPAGGSEGGCPSGGGITAWKAVRRAP